MALVQLVLSLAPYCHCFGNGVVEERRRVIPPSESPGGGTFSGRIAAKGLTKRLSPESRGSLSQRYVSGRSTLTATEVDSGQIGGLVEIPVTCYQFLGLSLKAEKDEVVKAVMDLKGSEIEAGYTGDAIFSRQHLLMDIRDKLLFEPDYAGNLKENIPPKSSLRIPWAWLPGALCLLQEEKWLKDAVLSKFPDTRECTSSLPNFFGGPKRILNGSNKKIGTSTSSYANNRLPSFGLSYDNTTFTEHSPIKSARYMGEAVKQLAPVSLQTQSSVKKVTSMNSNPSNSPLKRSLNLQNSKFWESWSLTGDNLERIACTTFVGCVIFGVLKMLSIELGQPRIAHTLRSSQSRMSSNACIWTFGNTPGVKSYSFIDKNIFRQLKNLMALFKYYYRQSADRRKIKNPLLIDNLSSLAMASAVAGTAAYRRQMPFEEAERLVKQWQDIKAEALGPDHQIDTLSEILSESMLSKWQDLASSAKNGACFWRFVLLKLSILRADVVLDELGVEVAEVEAVIEEAAELVNDSQPRKPSYYNTYKVQYMLKKQDDGSWRFCSGDIKSSI